MNSQSIPSIPQIIGILNVTRDSYSDGGQYLDPPEALEHARRMSAAGAAIIEIGAESSHPDAENVSADEELRRLAPVLAALKADGAVVSVDTSKPEVMRRVLSSGADLINDINGFRNPVSIAAVRDGTARLICMFNRTAADAGGRARRVSDPDSARSVSATGDALLAEIEAFFRERLATLSAAGIDRERLIFDPGMGFFLGDAPGFSLTVLAGLPQLARLGVPLCVSPSRKSFIGAVLARDGAPRPVAERGAGSLAAELWAAEHGAAYIRTHDVPALSDGLVVRAALGAIQS